MISWPDRWYHPVEALLSTERVAERGGGGRPPQRERKKIMHGSWMSWRTRARANEFRPIFTAPPEGRTIILLRAMLPTLELPPCRGRARVGRGKCACAKTARRIIVRLGWKSNSTTLYTMVVVAVCVRVDPRKILIGALATDPRFWYVLTRTAS